MIISTSNWMKRFAVIAGSALMGLLLAAGANAATPETVVAQVTFVNPITIAQDNSLQYGTLDHTLNEQTIIIAPDSTVSGTGTAFVIGVAPKAAKLTVGSDVRQALTILVDNIVNGTGYLLTDFVCNYDNGTDTPCNSYNPTSVASATLLIGATLTGDNNAVPGDADGSFDVTITYP